MHRTLSAKIRACPFLELPCAPIRFFHGFHVRSAVARTAERFILRVTPFEEFSQADFERMLAVNVQGVFAATQEAVRHMKAGGPVIMIGSINSEFVPFVGGSIYALTKAALVGFTHGLARDLGPRGITVNNIQPGPVDTDMNPADGPSSDYLKGIIALQRYGKPEEIAALVSFLCSDEAAYITGASLKADGGATA